MLRDAFAAQLAGVYAPFKDYAGHHLARRIPRASNKDTTTTTTSEEAAAKIFKAWTTSAEPYPDISYGITKLQVAGIKIAVLTNGSVKVATAILEKAGLLTEDIKTNDISAAGENTFTTMTNTNTISIFDINETLAWKPAKESYLFVCNALALSPSDVFMVASHPWDCHGALQAGLKAAYVQRDPREPYPEFLDQPQMVVTDFKELAETLALAYINIHETREK